MTALEYLYLIDRIVNRTVDPPTVDSTEELNGWLGGYAECQLDILNVIAEVRKESKDDTR